MHALLILVGPERIEALRTAIQEASSKAAEAEEIARKATQEAERLRRKTDEMRQDAAQFGLHFPDIF